LAPRCRQHHSTPLPLAPPHPRPPPRLPPFPTRRSSDLSSGSYTQGTSVLIPAPSGGGNDGVHTIDYYSTDKAGNTEATKHATVRIDTVTPVSSARSEERRVGKERRTRSDTASDTSKSSGT